MKKITIGIFAFLGLQSFAQWTPVTSGTTGQIDAIHFIDASKGYCGGGFVNLKVTNDGGNSWSTASTQKIRDFSFVDINNGYAASVVGTSMAKTVNGGTAWTMITPPTSNSLWAVSATSATTAYFVGTGGVLWKTANAGTSVSVMNSGTFELLTDIVFINPTTGFILGQETGIRRTTNSGVSWTVVQATTSMTEMCMVNATLGYAVGNGSKIFKTIDGGLTWTAQTVSGTVNLQGVHFFDVNHGVAVALSGKIIYTNDGGVNWNLQNSGTTQHLRDVRMLSATKAIVVGDAGTILKNDNITLLGTEDFNLENDITIYPNPTNHMVNIHATVEINSVVISDVAGNIVYDSKNVQAPAGTIDVSSYASGIYFATIASDKGIVVRKFVKN